MVLRQVPSPGLSRRSSLAEHRYRPAAAVRKVLSERKAACLSQLRRSPPGKAGKKIASRSRIGNQMPVTDIHTHFFPESWPDLAARFGTPDWPWIKHNEPGKAAIMIGNRVFRQITSACWDASVRLEQMDRDGVNQQIVSATPVLFAYNREPQHALDCARQFNDAALELCARGKGRLRALCQVPLQDIDASCAELTRCMSAGHSGVQLR